MKSYDEQLLELIKNKKLNLIFYEPLLKLYTEGKYVINGDYAIATIYPDENSSVHARILKVKE